MTPSERRALREQFGFRCGYCGVHESEVGAQLTVDHFQPRSQGGADEPENWVFCCHACNEFKADYWRPDSPHRLLHPQRDDLTVHVAISQDGKLLGLTEAGSFHIRRLRLNRTALVEHRREQMLLEAERVAYEALLSRLSRLEDQVTSLQTELQRLQVQPPDDLP